MAVSAAMCAGPCHQVAWPEENEDGDQGRGTHIVMAKKKSYGLYGYGPCSSGLYSYGMYRYGLYGYGMNNHGLT